MRDRGGGGVEEIHEITYMCDMTFYALVNCFASRVRGMMERGER